MRLADQLRTTTFLLTFRYMVLFFVSVTILLVFVSWSATGFLEQETEATISADVAGLTEQFLQRGPKALARTVGMRVSADPDGDAVYLIADAELNPLVGNIVEWPQLQAGEDGWVAFELEENGDRVPVRARVLLPQPDMRLIVGRKVRALNQLGNLFDRTLFWGLAITLALALVTGLLMSNNVLRRVGQFNATSKRIMAGDLSQRIARSGTGDEFDELANNLNAMMDQIESLLKNIQHISDNIAHDLRTPLTRLRNRLEDLQQIAGDGERDEIEACIADADGLLSTFASLLSIARIESGTYATAVSGVDIGQCVRDAFELYKALADEKSISLECDAPGEFNVSGDRNLLFQAITNLIDNAIKYTPSGGQVAITVDRLDGRVRLSVADSGPGIPADMREQVLQRFFRLDKSRSEPGAGLGLSLVQAIAQRHAIDIELDDNHPGLIIRLIFPGNRRPGAENMIELVEGPAETVIAVRYSGQISAADFAAAADRIETRLGAQTEPPGLMIDIAPSFKKFTSTAFWDHPLLGLHHPARFRRIGIVTDVDWIVRAARALNAPDRIQCFSRAEASAATAWLVS